MSENRFNPPQEIDVAEARALYEQWLRENPKWLETWERFVASGLRVDMDKVKELEAKLQELNDV